MSYQSDAMGPRSVFLGVGASVRGWKQRPEAPFLASVPLLARALRLEHLTVLKMDCEGCECAPPPYPLHSGPRPQPGASCPAPCAARPGARSPLACRWQYKAGFFFEFSVCSSWYVRCLQHLTGVDCEGCKFAHSCNPCSPLACSGKTHGGIAGAAHACRSPGALCWRGERSCMHVQQPGLEPLPCMSLRLAS